LLRFKAAYFFALSLLSSPYSNILALQILDEPVTIQYNNLLRIAGKEWIKFAIHRERRDTFIGLI